MLTIVFHKPYPEKPVIVDIPVVDIAFSCLHISYWKQ